MNNKNQFSRRSFVKTLGLSTLAAPFITRGLMAQSPNGMLQHASIGTGGMGWNDLTQFGKLPHFKLVAICDVDTSHTIEARKQFPGIRVYQDWRRLLDQESKNIDSINVATPDHMHAPIEATAMHHGKHIYGQKPLGHDIYEVRRLTDIAREKKLVTQMGIQIHSSSQYRNGVQIIKSGTIGKITEVHSWCPKSWGDTSPKPDRTDPVPESLDWNLWLGVCSKRPFIGNGYYHPVNWRKRLDFGTGTFGDMGCHIFDPVFNSLELGPPLTVRSEGTAPNQWNWALNSIIHYTFAGTKFTAGSVLPVTWYDGASKPPDRIKALLEGDNFPNSGSVFVGTDGVMVLPHIADASLYPDAKFKDFKYPKMGEVNHWGEFVDACLGEGKTLANFSYAGPLTEAVLLGGVASRFPQTTLQWSPHHMTFNVAEANQFIRRDYRSGWHVRGLSHFI